MTRKPFPLQWPDDLPRAKPGTRRASKFGAKGRADNLSPFQEARLVYAELDRLGAANYVLTCDLPTRSDGLPYADGRRRDIDPGVAAWFVLDGHERVFACDAWLSIAENMHAIALSIEAMRGLDRWGITDIVKNAFRGFAALPPGSSGTIDTGPVKRPWREVIGGTWPSDMSKSELLDVAHLRYKRLIRDAHPDREGGDAARAAELNVAMADAEAELGEPS